MHTAIYVINILKEKQNFFNKFPSHDISLICGKEQAWENHFSYSLINHQPHPLEALSVSLSFSLPSGV